VDASKQDDEIYRPNEKQVRNSNFHVHLWWATQLPRAENISKTTQPRLTKS